MAVVLMQIQLLLLDKVSKMIVIIAYEMENLHRVKKFEYEHLITSHGKSCLSIITFHQIQKVYHFVCSLHKWYPISHKGSPLLRTILVIRSHFK